MTKYRKKPVVIEAVQWFPESMFLDGVVENEDGTADIETLEGTMLVRPGDWVITGVHGEKYPCKDAIFQKTYEPVEQDGDS